MNSASALSQRAGELHRVLPQTQCTRCGYPDCEAYARAIDAGQAAINQCPPGGGQGIMRLAAIMQCAPLSLNPEHGTEAPRQVVWIDEDWCIGCTLCIKACPADAITGSNKFMHTVIESECTGCELCIPVCPVDCMHLENASGTSTGWDAWSPEQAARAGQRYQARRVRLQREEQQRQEQHAKALQNKARNLAAHSHITDPQLLEQKKSVIEQALARARERAGKPQT